MGKWEMLTDRELLICTKKEFERVYTRNNYLKSLYNNNFTKDLPPMYIINKHFGSWDKVMELIDNRDINVMEKYNKTDLALLRKIGTVIEKIESGKIHRTRISPTAELYKENFNHVSAPTYSMLLMRFKTWKNLLNEMKVI